MAGGLSDMISVLAPGGAIIIFCSHVKGMSSFEFLEIIEGKPWESPTIFRNAPMFSDLFYKRECIY